jgi:putative tryptophan/tyrosine transport system substrate-binding protein
MRRRDLLLGGASVAWVHGGALAWSQAPHQRKRIGVLLEYAEDDAEGRSRLAAFIEALRGHGWEAKRNVHIEYRFAAGDSDRIRSFADELVKLKPDVLFGSGAPVTAALRTATQTTPIVFVQASDPVGAGLVPNLRRPGGNVTGFTNFEYSIVGKWLELLREAAPSVSRVMTIQNPANFGWPGYLNAMEAATRSVSVGYEPRAVRTTAEIKDAIGSLASLPAGGLVVLPDTTTSVNRKLIVALARHHRLPAIYPFRFFVAEGGLLSYGLDVLDVFGRAASYVDRILRGENAGDLPIQAPTKFELTINITAAKALNLSIPPTLLARADEVIE